MPLCIFSGTRFVNVWNLLVALVRYLLCGMLWAWTALLTSAVVAMPQPSVKPTHAANLVRLAAEDNWPPFSDEQGNGISRDIVRAALASQGYQLETIAMPYARALHETAQGKVDGCWNVTRQQSTAAQYVLPSNALFQAQASFYYRHAGLHYQSVSDIPDGTVVGVILGYEYGDLYEQHKHRFKLVEVSTHAQLIQLLVSGKLEVTIFFDDVLAYYLAKPDFAKVRLVRGHVNHVSDIFVAFSKRNSRSVEYANALDAGLRELKRSGLYDKLMQQLPVPPPAAALDQR